MPLMTDEQIAARFEAFLGREAYVQFLTDLNTGPVVLGAQQRRLWRAFQATAPGSIPSSTRKLLRILQICHVHLQRLQPGQAPVLYGYVTMSDADWETQRLSFPFAKTVVLGGCMVDYDDGLPADVDYCPACREAEAAWAAAQPAESDIE